MSIPKPNIILKIENRYQIEIVPVYCTGLRSAMVFDKKEKGKGTYYVEGGKVIGLNLSDLDIEDFFLSDELIDLKYLDLSDNDNLKSIQFKKPIASLEYLDFSDCSLTEITFPFGFYNLREIDAARNLLERVNLGGDMPDLLHLDLSDNKLVEFSMPVIFSKLKYLYLKGNAIQNLPKHIIERVPNCAEKLKTHLSASQLTGNVLNTHVKCILFGNGTVGKTTIARKLIKDSFTKDYNKTHGIKIQSWEIKKEDFSESMLSKINDTIQQYEKEKTGKEGHLQVPASIFLKVWDFGGQEYFHATHRLFLSNNALYLILWTKELDKQDEPKGNYPRAFWKKNISHYAPKHTLLTVHNKENGDVLINHSNNEYKIALLQDGNINSIEDFERDIEVLKSGITDNLASLQYVFEPIPSIYDKVREKIAEKAVEIPFIDFDEFTSICQKQDTTDEKIMHDDKYIEALTEFLHDTGSIISYRYRKTASKLLQNYVFINPNWVTDTIYEILHEGLIENGEFSKLEVEKILSVTNNHIKDATLWLDLMTEFELIFKKRGGEFENIYIAPQFLPAQNPEGEKTKRKKNRKLTKRIEIHYPIFLPRSIISRFICHYGEMYYDDYWKYGIVIDKYDEEALVYCDYERRSIFIKTQSEFSDLAKEIFQKIIEIDNAPEIEIAVSHHLDDETLYGPVELKKLRDRISKNRQYLDCKDKEYEIKYFAELFKTSSSTSETSREQDKRGVDIEEIADNIFEVQVNATPNRNKCFLPESLSDIHLLFLSATPLSEGQINTGLESDKINTISNDGGLKRKLIYQDEHGVDKKGFSRKTYVANPQILHYAGHGEKDALVLENGERLYLEELKDILEKSRNIQCLVLNACESDYLGEDCIELVPYVICTVDKVDDEIACVFSDGFYFSLRAGRSVREAFEYGLDQIEEQGFNYNNDYRLYIQKYK